MAIRSGHWQTLLTFMYLIMYLINYLLFICFVSWKRHLGDSALYFRQLFTGWLCYGVIE